MTTLSDNYGWSGNRLARWRDISLRVTIISTFFCILTGNMMFKTVRMDILTWETAESRLMIYSLVLLFLVYLESSTIAFGCFKKFLTYILLICFSDGSKKSHQILRKIQIFDDMLASP